MSDDTYTSSGAGSNAFVLDLHIGSIVKNAADRSHSMDWNQACGLTANKQDCCLLE